MEELRVRYSAYKKHYADCETLKGSYDERDKTIVVLVPEGRLKPSGVRGRRYRYYYISGIERGTGREVCICIKAITYENAIKQLNKYYKEVEWQI